MKADVDRALLGASLAFAAASVLGSVVAVRDQLPGEPLGVGIPLSVPAGLLAGWGAAVAAPWPMPVAAITAAVTARHREPSTRPGLACAAIGPGVHRRHPHRAGDPPATVVDLGNPAGDRRQPGSVGRSDWGWCLACGHCAPPAPWTSAALASARSQTGSLCAECLRTGSCRGM